MRRRAAIELGVLVLCVGGSIGLGVACIIPDTRIQVRSSDENLNVVRFIEGVPLDEPARAACDEETLQCPMPDLADLPTFLDPADYPFCICAEDKIDANRLPGVTVQAEDADAEDELRAALILDWSPVDGDSAFDYIAYRNYLDPIQALEPVGGSYQNNVIKRTPPSVYSITLTDTTGRFDLCNGAGRELSGGFHTLTLMVTDRPWFTTEPIDVGTEGGGQTMPITLEGVPDIAAGATYDIETYVFNCYDEASEPDLCNCVETD